MKVFIPELGTVLILAEDWIFPVVNETRNAGLAKLKGAVGDHYFPFGTEPLDQNSLDPHYTWRRKPKDAGSHIFLAGTSLCVDRIYVRKGNEEFSSVSFKTYIGSKLLRFFAKLDDVNRIEL